MQRGLGEESLGDSTIMDQGTVCERERLEVTARIKWEKERFRGELRVKRFAVCSVAAHGCAVPHARFASAVESLFNILFSRVGPIQEKPGY